MLLSALFEPRDIKNRAARKEKPRERNSTLHCIPNVIVQEDSRIVSRGVDFEFSPKTG